MPTLQDLSDQIQQVSNRLIDLDQKFRRHNHDGVETEQQNTGVFYIPVSYETDEIADIDLFLPFRAIITKIRGRTTKAIEATDDATTTVKDSAGNTMATITFDAGTAIDQDATEQSPSSDNRIGKDTAFTLTQAKATPGGKAIIIIEYRRL